MHLGRPRGRGAGGLLRTIPALVLVAGCSSSPGADPDAAAAHPGSSAVHVAGADTPAPAVQLRSGVTRVAGHLSDVRRKQVARQARATVQDYLDGAFAASGHGPFRRFLPGVRRTARADGNVLTEPAGPARSGTPAVRAAAWFSVAAPAGRPVGVTARVRVDLPDGSLTGRLLLTRADGRWRVFGYDLARSGATSAGAKSAGAESAGIRPASGGAR